MGDDPPRITNEEILRRLDSMERRLAALEGDGAEPRHAPRLPPPLPPAAAPTAPATRTEAGAPTAAAAAAAIPHIPPSPQFPPPQFPAPAVAAEPGAAPPIVAPRPKLSERWGAPTSEDGIGSAERFIGIKLFGWGGGLAILLAAAFFLKLAFDRGWISPEVRIAMGAAAGLALLLGGEILVRRDLRGVAAAVAGSGIAILTLTNWAAFALYALSGFPVAFALGCAITVIGYAWSVWRSLVLTLLLAEIGGFLTPVLIQKESTGPWSLALYLALVAGAAGFGAARRAWRSPTVLGIFGILVIYTAWIAANSSRVYESWTVSTGWAVAFLTAVPALDVAWRAIRGIRLGKQEAPALFCLLVWGGGVVTVYLEERFRTDLGTILGVYAAMLFAICTFARPEARAVRSVWLVFAIAAVTGALGCFFVRAQLGVAWAAWAAVLIVLEARTRAIIPLLGAMFVHALVAAWIASLGQVRENTNFLWTERATVCVAEALSLYFAERMLRRMEGPRAWVGRAAMIGLQVVIAVLLWETVPEGRVTAAWCAQALALAWLARRAETYDLALASMGLLLVSALRFAGRDEIAIAATEIPFANLRFVKIGLAAATLLLLGGRFAALRKTEGDEVAAGFHFFGVVAASLGIACEAAFLRSRNYGDMPAILRGDLALGDSPYVVFWNGRFVFLAAAALVFAVGSVAARRASTAAREPAAERSASAAEALIAYLLVWFAVSLEAMGIANGAVGANPLGEVLLRHRSDVQAALSIAMGAVPAIALLLGFRRSRLHRYFGLAGLIITAGKVMLVDLAGLAIEWRMLVFLGLGMVLLFGAYLYSRAVRRG